MLRATYAPGHLIPLSLPSGLPYISRPEVGFPEESREKLLKDQQNHVAGKGV